MGWASGSILFDKVIDAVEPHVPAEKRKALYIELIGAFEDQDWDTQDECMGRDPEFDAALKELHPGWYD